MKGLFLCADSKGKIKWIDNAKGIAILCVIVGHVSGNLTGIWNFQFVYGFHLVVFFLISGYTLKKVSLDGQYVSHKFSRLMCPYFYTCIAVMLMDIINTYYYYNEGSAIGITAVISRDLLRSFFASGAYTNFGTLEIGTRIGAIWFLPALFFAIIIFQFMLQVTERIEVLGFCSAMIALGGMISARFIWFPFSIQSGMMAVFFVWIGYAVKKFQILQRIKWYHYLVAQIVFLWGIYEKYCGLSFVTASANDIVLSVIVGICACVLIYLLASHMEWSIIISYAGRNSLNMLCVHLFALETLGVWIEDWLDTLTLQGNLRVYVLIIVEILIAYIGSMIITILRNTYVAIEKRCVRQVTSERDRTIDIARGIFIIAMIIGHFTIDATLRRIIYSCHMIAFIFFSGYFYKQTNNTLRTIKHMCKAFLCPYLTAVMIIVMLNYKQWTLDYFAQTIKQYLVGMSFSNKLFAETSSVGPIYFILLLFTVRLIYMIVDMITENNFTKWLVVLSISFLGVWLGRQGYWLPWSLDIACYALIFYHLGKEAGRYHVLEHIRSCNVFYFLAAPIWVYMIYASGMEIAVRNYGQYGVAVIGALAGVLLIYKMGGHIGENFYLIGKPLEYCGRYSIIILIVHTAFGSLIRQMIGLKFNPNSACYLFCCVMVQILGAILFGLIWQGIKYKIVKKRTD